MDEISLLEMLVSSVKILLIFTEKRQVLVWHYFKLSLSHRNQPTDLLCKSEEWILYDRDLRHERVKVIAFP